MDDLDDTFEQHQAQEFTYKKVSSPKRAEKPRPFEENEFEMIDDPDQYQSPSHSKILNKKNDLYDEVFNEVMKEKNPIEALNSIAMNYQSDRRFDFIRDDQFFWNRLADVVAQEHHR